ncbi:pyridoxamine 5'-phosphate oxidase family protein [Agrobacterium tumefaciens]|uniref:Pyridoxamine 5'-phosphate oxidase family protein n=1 Tax=Agrobacterium tumefaciens TaxID=358 RepID=A0A4D7YRC8_AGRTU|nr:pyridoxamine 5'-phosphate oxidase family protein [Agrobacterium tumefaciens]QCL97418.1 pyridoxamine 5'-phosphate oxidase family protein [Agrobacterium tumefaciens]
MLVREMTHNECLAELAEGRLARMACAKDSTPYVVPIYYAYSGNSLYAFSMPGKKLDFLRSNPRACLQVDKSRGDHQWVSVIVDAAFRELPQEDPPGEERLHAWSLLSHHFDWWEPGGLTPQPQPQPLRAASRHIFFALDINALSGREARLGEPERVSPQ